MDHQNQQRASLEACVAEFARRYARCVTRELEACEYRMPLVMRAPAVAAVAAMWQPSYALHLSACPWLVSASANATSSAPHFAMLPCEQAPIAALFAGIAQESRAYLACARGIRCHACDPVHLELESWIDPMEQCLELLASDEPASIDGLVDVAHDLARLCELTAA
jgi:hypothetical protein